MRIDEIKKRNSAAGYHFFKPATMRFFRSRIGHTVYSGNGRILFLTSEQFVGSDGHKELRRYTVREFDASTWAVKTVSGSGFNKLSRSTALTLAKRLTSD